MTLWNFPVDWEAKTTEELTTHLAEENHSASAHVLGPGVYPKIRKRPVTLEVCLESAYQGELSSEKLEAYYC